VINFLLGLVALRKTFREALSGRSIEEKTEGLRIIWPTVPGIHHDAVVQTVKQGGGV
jgi:hypothetical protein